MNLKALLKKFGMFFYLIAFVFILTAICTLYIFAYTKSSIEASNSYNESYRSYTIAQSGKDIEERIESFISANKKDIRRVYAVIANKDGRTIADYYGESAARFKVEYGNPAAAKNEITVPDPQKYNIGDSYKLRDREYKITGISFNDYQIVYDSSLNEENLVQGWVIVTDKILTGTEQNDFAAQIKEAFQTDNIELPKTERAEDDMNIVYIIITLLALLSIINLTFIYSCLLKRRKQQQAVFHILGCKKSRLFGIYIGEMLFITSILYIVCCVLTRFALFDVLSSLHPAFPLTLEFGEYLILFFIYVALIAIILTCQTALYFRKTPYEMKRG